MLQNTYKGMNLKIVYKDAGSMNRTDITKYLEINSLSYYEEFILELKKARKNNLCEYILVFLKYPGGEILVDKNSFEQIRNILYSRTFEEETYIVIQELKYKQSAQGLKCEFVGEKLVQKDHKEISNSN